MSSTSNSQSSSANRPRDVVAIEQILEKMGATNYDPRVVHQLIEFMHRYVIQVLTDAQDYSQHAGRPNISVNDVKLAIQAKLQHEFIQPPSREALEKLSASLNSIPLPPIIDVKRGVRIPLPAEECLTMQNFELTRFEPAEGEQVVKEPETNDDDDLEFRQLEENDRRMEAIDQYIERSKRQKKEESTRHMEAERHMRRSDRRMGRRSRHTDQYGDRHIERSDRHIERSDRHIERSGRHMERSNEYVEESERHMGEPDQYMEEDDRHMELDGQHMEESDDRIEDNNNHMEQSDEHVATSPHDSLTTLDIEQALEESMEEVEEGEA